MGVKLLPTGYGQTSGVSVSTKKTKNTPKLQIINLKEFLKDSTPQIACFQIFYYIGRQILQSGQEQLPRIAQY